jgi:hypothetical protein
MFQISRSYSWHVTATFAKKCREFVVAPRPFGPPRSPFAAGNEAANHVRETYSAKKDIRRSMCSAERGVGSYG